MWRPLAAARELGWAVLEKCDLARHSRVALPTPTNPSGISIWLVARAGVRQRDDSDHCVTPTVARNLCVPFLWTSSQPHTDAARQYGTVRTAGSAVLWLHFLGCDAFLRKDTHKIVTLGITPHRASGSGCGSNRDVPACLKHSGASPGKARCSELIAIDAQSTSPHDLPDVLGCAWMRLPAQEVRALFDSWRSVRPG